MNKKNVKIVVDFGLLDKGAEEKNPFVLLTGIEVDSNGEAVDRNLGAKMMSNAAVQNGATRIMESDCVDMNNALSSYNDKFVVFNGGDVYQPYDGDWARTAVADYSPEDRERSLAYITHRENRYDFLVAQGVFTETTEKGFIASFMDDVREFIGLDK